MHASLLTAYTRSGFCYGVSMKNLATLKLFLVVAVFVIMAAKSLPARRAARAQRQADNAKIPLQIAGPVTKVLGDGQFVYVLVSSQDDKFWVATRAKAPKVDEVVRCDVKKVIDAYESKGLVMGFERMHFTDAFETLSKTGQTLT